MRRSSDKKKISRKEKSFTTDRRRVWVIEERFKGVWGVLSGGWPTRKLAREDKKVYKKIKEQPLRLTKYIPEENKDV